MLVRTMFDFVAVGMDIHLASVNSFEQWQLGGI